MKIDPIASISIPSFQNLEKKSASAKDFASNLIMCRKTVLPGHSRKFDVLPFAKSARDVFAGVCRALVHKKVYQRELAAITQEILPSDDMSLKEKRMKYLKIQKQNLQDRACLEDRCFTKKEQTDFNEIEAELRDLSILWENQIRLKIIASEYQSMIDA